MMKIIFLNTWHSEMVEELRAYVQKHQQDTDIFCFQEALAVDREAYHDLLAEEYAAIATEKTINQDILGNVLYYRKTMDLREQGVLLADDKLAGLGIYAVFAYKGQKVTIANIHGVPQPGHKLDTPERLGQSCQIIDTLAKYSNVVVGGDFNLLPQSESVKMFERSGYRNLIADYAVASTRNQIVYDRYPDNIQYFADYVFTSNNIMVQDFTVPTEIISDHQPLEIVFETQ